ncbi:pyridoxamine 5'-phosphate oxidase family protein [Lachnospiraceae bacterium MD1]|uniref:Pyridoxamine 5'-phosphate oxidase family protein n=1 Tax=Variimorphobacter saccharofermentans TaxID=2755051 RepID=A0A839K4H6_9FIRM|nr:pyridoxamine 5'-phosphate oxidase family protein [Variimorphobacter saccharofermentans]MBB2183949.1 pyridoxamine 5'-phosphate oxidase family protein [Variimorphobacter saccharofermentans]
MGLFEKSMNILTELFGQDFLFSLATVKDQKPAVRVIDTYCEDGIFWVVTHALSNKVKEIEANSNVALCNNFYSFTGNTYNVGHPLKEENRQIREKLIKVFEPWYYAHNDENDNNMCYVRIDLTNGFFHKDGKGYKVDFVNKTAEEFPFAPAVEVD